VQEEDIASICEIYNYYVENTNISFEEQRVSEKEMEKRIHRIIESYPWIVYELDKKVAGFAYISQWKERSAYRFTAEDTIYVKNDMLRRGIGKALLKNIIEETHRKGIHALMAVIALPNENSIKLHESFGFRKAAHFAEVGYKNEEWIDVGYWELQTC
jgi:phosphinothricin acetyltransferase